MSTSAAAATKKKEPKPFPSNLKVDPRSSYAPVNKKPILQKIAASPTTIPVEQLEDDDKEKPEDASAATTEGAGKDANQLQQEVEEEGEYYSDDDEEEEEEEEWVFEAPKGILAVPLPERLHVPIYNFGGSESYNKDNDNDDNNKKDDADKDGPEKVGTIWLNDTIFGKDPVRIDLLKRAVDYHRAKKRGRRKAHSKRIGDIRGSTRKMRPQKGQGAARAGHRFAAHWRGGAKAHGPTNETHYGRTKLNKKVRAMAVRHVLSQKLLEGNLILINQFSTLPSHRTNVLARWLEPFGIAGRHGTTALMLDNYYPQASDNDNNDEEEATTYRGVPVNLAVASGNLFKVSVGNQLRNLNVYDVLKHEKLVLSLEALTALEKRLKQD